MSDRLASALYAGMSEVVDGVEDASAPRVRDKRSGWAVTDVHKDCCCAEVDSSKRESGVWVFGKADQVRIEWLFLRHRCEIEAERFDGSDYARQFFKFRAWDNSVD